MRNADVVKLNVAVNDLAPVDQLLWLVWGLCVLDGLDGGELRVDVQGLHQGIVAGIEGLEASGRVATRRAPVNEPARSEHFAAVSSAAVVSPALMRFARQVFVRPSDGLAVLDPAWYWDQAWMRRFRERVLVLGEACLDVSEQAQLKDSLNAIRPAACRVSLVSSVFKADRFLQHFLSNCSELAGYREMEHWLIRAGSPGEEHAALLAHARSWPGAVYLNLRKDPGLYETWNLGCCLARGRYLSNANVDDRRHPEQVERLIAVLSESPEADLASAVLRVTTQANQDWNDWSTGDRFYSEIKAGTYRLPDLIGEVGGMIRSRNVPDCMPVWRRALHGFRGFFNESQYGPSADWEYWLRCAANGSCYHHLTEELGMYMNRIDSYWHGNPQAEKFDGRILDRYLPIIRSCTPDVQIRSLPWPDLTRVFAFRNWFGVMLCLLRINALPIDSKQAAPRSGNISAVFAQKCFGLLQFDALDHSALKGGSAQVFQRLKPVLLGWLDAFLESARKESPAASRQARNWRSLLVEWNLLTADVTPLIGLALMERRFYADDDAERTILRTIQELDPLGLHENIRFVYGADHVIEGSIDSQ